MHFSSSIFQNYFHSALLALITVSLFQCRPAADPEELNGKNFYVTLTDPGNQTAPDSLIFSNGTFEATGCRQYGFGAVPFQASGKGASIEFAATTQSAQEGEMLWKGMVRGDHIEGSVVWQKAGQDDINYQFSGHVE